MDRASARAWTKLGTVGALAMLAAACREAPRGADSAVAGSAGSAPRDSPAAAQGVPVQPCAPSLWAEGADTTGGARRKVTRELVSSGTRGSFEQVRWALSPD